MRPIALLIAKQDCTVENDIALVNIFKLSGRQMQWVVHDKSKWYNMRHFPNTDFIDLGCMYTNN
jgi:hypothetical protein